MRDGMTQPLLRAQSPAGLDGFLAAYRARVIVVAGASIGQEFSLDRPVVTLGRGPGVDFAFDDPSMSRQHAAIEFCEEGFRVRDLGSTNGLTVNGDVVKVGEVAHGDRFEIGALGFQVVIEQRKEAVDVYELTID